MRRRPIQIVVLVDGLGWEIVRGRDFLDDVLPYRRPLRTILGYSSGAIPTILTGKSPAEHGHWNLLYRDREGSPFRWLRRLDFLPDAVLDHRVTRRLLREIGRRGLGLGPLFECCVSPRLLPDFNWVERRNLYAPGGVTGAPSIFDRLEQWGVPARVYSYHRWGDADILERARRDVRESDAEFFFLYLCELDAFLHGHVGEPALVASRLGWYASGLAAIWEAARHRDSEASLTVVSDHGMTPVGHRHDLVADVRATGLSTPRDYLAVYDSTMARFWVEGAQVRDELTGCLARVRCGRLMAEAELRALGVWFDDRRYGDLVFLLEPGWLFARNDFDGAGWRPAGMHGYHPDDPSSDAVFLSTRTPSTAPSAIDDVYALMEETIEPPAWRGAERE